MPLRKPVRARRKPRQERSVATVDAILEAATYLLVRDGWAKLTTNRVAERAGVNIASVYQYFRNKEAIVAELQRRHSARIERAVRQASPTGRSRQTLRSLLREVIAAVVDEHRVEPALHRVFEEELPLSARRRIAGSRSPLVEHWRETSQQYLKHLPRPDVAAFIARTCAHAVVHQAAIEHPEFLRDATLVDELLVLLERYLDRRAKA
jgi:AcrR family transcriptional regulator